MSGAVIGGEIVERADEVPLFVEELTKAVAEAGDSGPGIVSCSMRSAGQDPRWR
jgi:hypothetical protein